MTGPSPSRVRRRNGAFAGLRASYTQPSGTDAIGRAPVRTGLLVRLALLSAMSAVSYAQDGHRLIAHYYAGAELADPRGLNAGCAVAVIGPEGEESPLTLDSVGPYFWPAVGGGITTAYSVQWPLGHLGVWQALDAAYSPDGSLLYVRVQEQPSARGPSRQILCVLRRTDSGSYRASEPFPWRPGVPLREVMPDGTLVASAEGCRPPLYLARPDGTYAEISLPGVEALGEVRFLHGCRLGGPATLTLSAGGALLACDPSGWAGADGGARRESRTTITFREVGFRIGRDCPAFDPERAWWSPDGKTVVFESTDNMERWRVDREPLLHYSAAQDGGLWLMGPSGLSLVARVHVTPGLSAVWAPDGSCVYVPVPARDLTEEAGVPAEASAILRVFTDGSPPTRYGPLLFDLRHLGLWQPKRVASEEDGE